MILSGELELSMFTPSMRALIKHVVGMGSHLKQQSNQNQTGGGSSDGGRGSAAHEIKPSAFMPVIVDMSRVARDTVELVGDLSRPNPVQATALEIKETMR